MENYLFKTEFAIYEGGLYQGIIRFKEDKIEIAPVDKRTREPLYFNEYKACDAVGRLGYNRIHRGIAGYASAKWDNVETRLSNGDLYSQHKTYSGQVDGKNVSAQLWAQRESGDVIDIITVDGEVVAFIHPGRTGMVILVKNGYQELTPLSKYDDPILSPIKYGINFLGNFMVAMRDGIKLATEVYLPEGISDDQKVPSIFVRTCYGKAGERDKFMHFVSRGYAVLIQDVRGRDDSEGDFLPYYHEREDGSDSIDWIAGQKWSNGNVGMWGASYLGYIVMAAAGSGNPHLKSVVCEVNVGSPFIDTIRPGGTVGSWLTLCWSLAQSTGQRIDFDVFTGQSIDVEKVVKTKPLREIPQKNIGKASHHWDIWSKHYRYDDFWRHGDLTEHAHKIRAAILIQSGWHDGDIKGVAESWKALTKYDVPNRRIVLGPWHHGLNSNRDMLDIKYGNNAIDYDFDIRTLKWFDRFLKNIENGEDKKPRATYYLDNENKWMTSNDWFPEETRLTNFYLSSNGNANSRLGDGKIVARPVATKEDTYVFDPNNPLGTENLIETEPIILNEIEMRCDTLVYTTDKLEENLAVVGSVQVEFYASSSAVDTDWCVFITDIDESGVSRKIGENMIRAEYRKGFNNPDLLTPNKVEKYQLDLPFQAHVFPKGHKLGILISSSNQYMFFPNTNTGIDPFEEPKSTIARQKIYHDEKYPSHIKVPILYGRL